MTRLAILADLHGNLPALQAVSADLDGQGVDHVLVAGDLISVGPDSVAVLDWVCSRGWSAIRGNHEFYLLHHGTPREPAHWEARYAMPRWLAATIPAAWRCWLATMPDELTLHYPDAPPLGFYHGLPGDPWHGITPVTTDDEAAAGLQRAAAHDLIVGHTHLGFDRCIAAGERNWHVVNPGSVGIPLDGDPRAAYALLDGSAGGWRAELRRVAYDLEPLWRRFAEIDYVGQCGATGRIFIEEIRQARMMLIPFIHWRQTHYPGQPESLAQAEAFLTLPDAEIDALRPLAYQLG